jgi:flagellar biosynthesis/type III secretory pathway chaperone
MTKEQIKTQLCDVYVSIDQLNARLQQLYQIKAQLLQQLQQAEQDCQTKPKDIAPVNE